VTLDYIPADDPMPIDTMSPQDIDFDEVYLVVGDEWTPFKMGAQEGSPASSPFLNEGNEDSGVIPAADDKDASDTGQKQSG